MVSLPLNGPRSSELTLASEISDPWRARCILPSNDSLKWDALVVVTTLSIDNDGTVDLVDVLRWWPRLTD